MNLRVNARALDSEIRKFSVNTIEIARTSSELASLSDPLTRYRCGGGVYRFDFILMGRETIHAARLPRERKPASVRPRFLFHRREADDIFYIRSNRVVRREQPPSSTGIVDVPRRRTTRVLQRVGRERAR